MIHAKSKTIFSKIIPTPLKKIQEDSESRKISYWLEKLHIQGEKSREENSRRTEQSQDTARKGFLQNRILSNKIQDLAQSGKNEYTKNIAIKNEADRQAVNDLIKKSNRCIVSISSMFPWALFPQSIDVEESRVTFRFSQFFSSQSHSVDIRDISNVFLETAFFFATLQVVSRTYIQNDIKIGYLHKDKARKVQRIIEGLRTFAEHKVNTSNYEIDELIEKIEEFHTNHII